MKTIFKPGLFQYNISWNVVICTIFTKEALKMKKYDFFISYRNNSRVSKKKIVKSIFSRKEIHEEIGNIIADGIHNVLKTKMYSHYYNPERFSVEKEYANRLEREVKNCKIFLWVLTGDCLYYRQSKDKIHQDWYFAEILWAAKYDKHILPVLDSSFIYLSRKKIASQFRMAFEALVEYFANFDEKERLFVEADRKKIEEFIQHICDHDTESEEKCRLGSYQKIKIELKKDDKAKNAVSNQSKAKNIDKKQLKKAIKTAVLGKGGVVKTAKNTNGINIWRFKLRIIQTITILLIIGAVVGGKKAYDYIQYNSTVWDGSYTIKGGWGSIAGDGSKENPWRIKSARELAWLSRCSLVEGFSGKYFRLENDIVLNEVHTRGILNDMEKMTDIYGNGERIILDLDSTHYWTPIGSEETPFAGNFDGNGHIIYGVLIVSDDLNYKGLFGKCSESSKIENINIVGANICEGSYVGALVGESEGIIDKCSVYSVFVSGEKYVGGIVGKGNIVSNSFASAWMGCSNRFAYTNEKGKTDRGNNISNEVIDEEYMYHGGICGSCKYLINSSGAIMLDEGEGDYIGGLAGDITTGAYNCVDTGVANMGYDIEWNTDDISPMTLCNVFGKYQGDEINYTNVFYNEKDEWYLPSLQGVTKEEFERLKNSGLANYLENVEWPEDKPTRMVIRPAVPFTYHDYNVETKKYNQISKPMILDDITDDLNEGVDNVKQRKDVCDILEKNNITLCHWYEDDDKGCLIYGTVTDKKPWLENLKHTKDIWIKTQ